MRSFSSSATREEGVGNPRTPEDDITDEELGEALSQIWRELSNTEPGQRSQDKLERAAEQFRTATADLLAAADQALADLREGRATTQMLLDRLEARLRIDG